MRAPRIIKILKIEPFKVILLWSNGEVRMNDFTDKLPIFHQSERLKPLVDFNNFSQVSINEGDTLYWKDIESKTSQGKLIPIAFDPDMLFENSVVVESPPIIEIDSRKEFTQSDYARRNGLTSSKVRTWIKRGKLKSRYVPHLGITLVIT
ncbi:MAG: DUF2442 domain-containing protein [Arcicella sp.]|nr:DUF2442 domain-containing protein [Arcicella sp.]